MSDKSATPEGQNIWQQQSNTYWPGNTSLNTEVMPPGVYRWDKNMAGWFLELTAHSFEFPYKIYGNHDHIIKRVQLAWEGFDGNLGILLNGLKGTGKTVSAQLIGNWAISKGLPVLVVSHPIPLSLVLERINQPCMVIFDEFEKTHQEEEAQQGLLTALDGMARNAHKRLFVFTTNSIVINDNFIDRPSRIRYCWEFSRLEDAIIEALLADLLDPELDSLKGDILAYLNTRKVLSIDVVKTVINEVNVFKEAPETFSEVMNLTEQEAKGFCLEILNENGEAIKTLAEYFRPNRHQSAMLSVWLTKTGRGAFIESHLTFGETYMLHDRGRSMIVELVEPTADPHVWLCHVKLPLFDTWLKKFFSLRDEHYEEALWLDERPKNWKIPAWAAKVGKEELTEDEEKEKEEWMESETVYGGDSEQRQKVPVRITPNYDSPKFSFQAF